MQDFTVQRYIVFVRHAILIYVYSISCYGLSALAYIKKRADSEGLSLPS